MSEEVNYYNAFIVNDLTGERRMFLVFNTDDQLINMGSLYNVLRDEGLIRDKHDFRGVMILSYNLRRRNCLVAVDSNTYIMPEFLQCLDYLNRNIKFR